MDMQQRLRGEAPGRTEKERAGEVISQWMQAASAQEREEETRRQALLGVDPTRSIEEQQREFLKRLSAVARVDPRASDAHLVRSQATEVFLRIESVQTRLAAMPVEERRTVLADIRRRMGFTEEAISQRAADDAHRDARWENGHSYMKARTELLSRMAQGEALDAALSSLREQHFGHEALTIAREEAAGFFRYERRRVYGRN